MNLKQKKSILMYLAQIFEKDSGAIESIQKESAKTIKILQNENQYAILADQLEILDVIAYRVHEETVLAIQDFLNRLKALDLTYDQASDSAESLRKYQNTYTLTVKALEILEHIRYYQPSEILNILFEYTCHPKESVAKQANHAIEKLATYDLDIFYGEGKDWSGLGWKPQEIILKKISTFDNSKKILYFSTILLCCQKILSPTIEGSSSSYKTFTWITSTLPAKDGVKSVRNEALNQIKHLYSLADNSEQKKLVLTTLNTATHFPHTEGYDNDVREMIIENTIVFLEFMKSIAISDDLQIMQKIEHDTYWLFYHKSALDKTIDQLSLEIRDSLYLHQEYQIFRILIGFESIFHDWENSLHAKEDFEQTERLRVTQAFKLAESINKKSYNEWKNRIINYASIKSNDLATFPHFEKFLEHFGKHAPELALQLLSDHSDHLENFIVAIFSGIFETSHKKHAYTLIQSWCSEGKNLFCIAHLFEYTSELDSDLLKKVLNKAKSINDLNTLNQIIISISAKYQKEQKILIKSLFMPAIRILTTNKNSNWIFGFWFRKQREDILSDMDIAQHKAILNNLIFLSKIDYHAEEILRVIAKYSPEVVIKFFCSRILKEKDPENYPKYDAVPYTFHKLAEPLSKNPIQAVNIVLKTYDGDYGLFVYRQANLLKVIFPNFPIEFQQKILEVAKSQRKKDILFVMAILRNYRGDPVINNLCKELIKLFPKNGDLESELSLIMQSTGVVSGEYGLVEAYKQKIEEIRPWLQDNDIKVKTFAESYLENLKRNIDRQQKRADEDIALRKHMYGTDEE